MTLIELYITWGEKGTYYHFYAYYVSAFPPKIYLFSAPPPPPQKQQQQHLSAYIFQFQFVNEETSNEKMNMIFFPVSSSLPPFLFFSLPPFFLSSIPPIDKY